MKREKTKTGWKEINTSEIIIKGFFPKVFYTAAQWVEFQKKNPGLNKKGRNHCQYCGIKWESLPPETNTYLASTNRLNKVLCQNCYDLFNQEDKT